MQKILITFTNKDIPIKTVKKIYKPLLIFVTLALMCFFPSRHYGMVTDFINWIYKYENGQFSDVLHCFEYPGLHQFFHGINYLIYKIIGTNTTAWYLVLSVVHGINAFALFKLTGHIQSKVGVGNVYIPVIISVIFIIFPYNIEAVVWKACLHYLIITFLFLIGVFAMINYLETGKKKYLLALHLLFICSLFTLELSFVFPLLYMVVGLFFLLAIDEKKHVFGRVVVSVFALQMVLLLGYLLLSKWVIGSYIGHYGAEEHLSLDVGQIVTHYWSYFFKNLGFVHHYLYNWKASVYTGFFSSHLVQFVLSALAVFVFYTSFKRLKATLSFRYGLVSFLLFFISLTPIVTLFFYWQHLFENDRYGYFSSLFFIIGLVMFVFSVKSKMLQKVLLGTYAFICFFLFVNMIGRVHEAAHVQHNLLSDFKIEDKNKDVFILGIPDNYGGLYLYRDHKDNAHVFRKSMSLMYDKNVSNKIYDVAQFNQVKISDALTASFIDSCSIQVQFDQYGNWFWRKGIGLSDYENETYSVTKNSGGYILKVKNPSLNQLFLYPKENKWQVLSWTDFKKQQ